MWNSEFRIHSSTSLFIDLSRLSSWRGGEKAENRMYVWW